MHILPRFHMSRARRGLAAACVVLATGGLILLRASADARLHPPTLTVSPPTPAGPLPPLPDGPNVAHFRGPGAQGIVALSSTKLMAGGAEDVFAEVRIRADAAERPGERAPLALAVVLDTSGSMEGEKMEQARDAVVKLIGDMRDDDQIAMVRYSDTATVVQNLARVDSVRTSLVSRVMELSAGGGTAIPLGLQAGMTALGDVGAGRVQRIVLVSDGLDSTRAQAEALARSSFARGITISSMGIGLDFDESYMGGLARAGHGNFGFVKDASSLTSFLHRELDEAATTTIENARVRIHLPANVRFVAASGADASQTRDDDVELELGSLFAGDERRALVHLTARAEAGQSLAFTGTAAWNRVGGVDAAEPFSGLTMVASRDRADVESSTDHGVLADWTSVTASERQLAAAEAYARGDTRAANALIDQNLDALGAAAAAAPAPVKAALAKQQKAYVDQKDGFRAEPGSARGKAAAKSAWEMSNSNATRSIFSER